MARTTLADWAVPILCEAIGKRAAVDYHEARKYFRDAQKKRTAPVDKEKFYYERLLSDSRTFFTSQWFYMMGGTPAMFEQLQKECNRGHYRKENT